MLAFNHIGRLGQLGKQMFQYSALKGIARHHGYDYMIPNHSEAVDDGIGNMLYTELLKPFDLDVKVGMLQTDQYIQEPHYEFSEELFNNCPDNASLVGFFQSEKYFKHIGDELRKDFTFRKPHVDDYNEISEVMDNPIAIHIRRGDFIRNYMNHHNLSLDYYEKALNKFDSNRQVIIFSDDPQWCVKQDLFESDRFLVSEVGDPYSDLLIMSKCSDFIIANSTFSWWGAWLCDNKDKVVICPSIWFGVNNQDKDIKDLYPEEWTVL